MAFDALVVAYDGGLVHTLDARALAVQHGLQAEGISRAAAAIRRALPGRTLAETVLAVVHENPGTTDRVPDPVALELAWLRAERHYASVAAQGLPFAVGASAYLQHIAPRARVIVRSDSPRRDVTRTLAMSHLEECVTTMHCSDDVTLCSGGSSDAPLHTLDASYRHIIERLASRGIPVSSCVVYEPDDLPREWARRNGFRVLESMSVG